MKKDAGFLVLVGLISVILLIGVSFLYFEPSVSGDYLFNYKYAPKYASTRQVSCVDSDNGMNFYEKGKVAVAVPSSGNLRLKKTTETKTYEDRCIDKSTLLEYYCKKGAVASIKNICDGICVSGACIYMPDVLPTKYPLKIHKFPELISKEDIVISEQGYPFKIYCKYPCPFSKDVLTMRYDAIKEVYYPWRDLVGVDFLPTGTIIYIHFAVDDVCFNSSYNYAATANGEHHLCIIHNDLDKDTAKILNRQVIVLHEMGHHLFYERSTLSYNFQEPLVVAASLKIGGTWCLNSAGTDFYECFPNSLCDEQLFASQTYKLTYFLCKYYGFDYKDVPIMMKKIDEEYNESMQPVDLVGAKHIIDEIVGQDTNRAFVDAGFGEIS